MKSIQWIRRLGVRGLPALLLIAPLILGGTSIAAAAPNGDGAVYVMTNAANGNAVMVFNRAADGALSAAGTFVTGGLGTGAPQEPLADRLSQDVRTNTQPLLDYQQVPPGQAPPGSVKVGF